MPDLSRLLVFFATSAVIIAIPGPSVIFIVSRALADGARAAFLSVVGNATGVYLQVLAVAFGIGTLVQDSVLVFSGLKIIGGLYLIYLGVRTFRRRKHVAAAITAETPTRSGRSSFLEAMFVGATNPKTVVFMAAILPQFVDRTAGTVPLQILVLGAIFFANAVLSDSVWVFAAGRFRGWFASSPKRLELIGGAGGVAIAAVGTGLLVSGNKS